MVKSGQVVVGAVPVKPFAAAKQRLAQALPEATRRRLSRELAEHTLTALQGAGAYTIALAADEEVAAWGVDHADEVLLDDGSSLNLAAANAVERAAGRGWLVCHADLPLLSSDDLVPAIENLRQGGAVVAPSSDGGTSLIGSTLARFAFSYGPGSFHRHLRLLAQLDPVVLVLPGLAIDLDQPADLRAVRDSVPWISNTLAGW